MDAPRRLLLEVTSADDPITGVLRAEDGAPRAFSGWLSLAVAIDEALAPGPARLDTAATAAARPARPAGHPPSS
jgi:hypothetical protein